MNMLNLRSLIVDDERAARARLRRLIAERPEVEILDEAANGIEALDKISTLSPDLVFLDIQMPGLDGFQMLRSLPEEVELPLIIFTTGFEEHALRAFEASALDYLLKPIEAERLNRAIDKALCFHRGAEDQQEQKGRIREFAQAQNSPTRKIVARRGNHFILLSPNEILFLYIDGGITRARTVDSTYWITQPFTDIETSLPDCFFRARRGVLVNLEKVTEIKPFSRSTFVLLFKSEAGNHEITVSDRQATALRTQLPGL